MSRLMKIRLSVPTRDIPEDLIGEFVAQTLKNELRQGQTVSYFNALGENLVSEGKPEEIRYEDAPIATTVLLNYVNPLDSSSSSDLNIKDYQGLAPIRTADISDDNSLAVSVFKQEVSYDKEGNLKERTAYYPVNKNAINFHFKDYNVSNNRFYRYILYPSNQGSALSAVERTVKTKWQGWSIAELHPVDASMTKFTVSSKDVWVFNSNVETGEQQQHIAMNEQQTLGTYPRFSMARQNYIGSNVSCLLGDVMPVEYIIQKRKEKEKNNDGVYIEKTYEDLIYKGGYIEERPFAQKISSNDKVDMLLAWRKLVHSGNPKLLKDRKGQKFIVAITESSNKPADNIAVQPDTISFSWVQIASADNVQIIENSIKGGGANI